MSSSSDQTRRTVILAALATAAGAAASPSARADDDQAGDDQPGSGERPQKADVLVFAEGERAGEVVKPGDLKLDGPPVRAWPKDPKTSVVRKGSRLNEVLIIRLDPGELDDETRARFADGIVAYSDTCTHAGCPITAWVKGRRVTRTFSNAFATIPNLTRGKARKSCSGRRPGVWRRFRWRLPTAHARSLQHSLER
jgi:rieske iron-sulfur protein